MPLFNKIETPSILHSTLHRPKKCRPCGKPIIRRKNHPRDSIMGSHKVFPRVVEDSDKRSKRFVCSTKVQNIIDKSTPNKYAKKTTN